jgi:hypothetical protein
MSTARLASMHRQGLTAGPHYRLAAPTDRPHCRAGSGTPAPWQYSWTSVQQANPWKTAQADTSVLSTARTCLLHCFHDWYTAGGELSLDRNTT